MATKRPRAARGRRRRQLHPDASRREALDTGGALLLAGDVFDLTGMQPPQSGLMEFFANAASGKTVQQVPARSLAMRLQAALDHLPAFRTALKPLAETGRLWLMAGNHDCGLDSETARAVLGSAIGVDQRRLRFEQNYRVEDVLLAAHGHEFDSSNGTADGCANAGSIVVYSRRSRHSASPPRLSQRFPACGPKKTS